MNRQRMTGRWRVRLPLAAALLVSVLSLGNSAGAQADTILKAATTMVFGTSADTYSLDAPSAGKITAQISSVPWPSPLSALSFDATSATSVLQPLSTGVSALDAEANAPMVETFQVSSAGTYFAHVTATAGANQFNLGLYSLLVTFTPAAVPLPAAVGLLLMGLFVLLALRSTMRPPRNESVMSAV